MMIITSALSLGSWRREETRLADCKLIVFQSRNSPVVLSISDFQIFTMARARSYPYRARYRGGKIFSLPVWSVIFSIVDTFPCWNSLKSVDYHVIFFPSTHSVDWRLPVILKIFRTLENNFLSRLLSPENLRTMLFLHRGALISKNYPPQFFPEIFRTLIGSTCFFFFNNWRLITATDKVCMLYGRRIDSGRHRALHQSYIIFVSSPVTPRGTIGLSSHSSRNLLFRSSWVYDRVDMVGQTWFAYRERRR